MKKYINIREASLLVGIKEHIIRYWDSIDPKTNRLRIPGISVKSKGGTRYFNNENIAKLKKIKSVLYENGSHNYSLSLANKITSKKNRSISFEKMDNHDNNLSSENVQKIAKILTNMRNLLK